jgi:FkbM family methyltransferase
MKRLEDLVLNNVLDIGANIGNFSQYILSINPNCYCFMVEGNPYCKEYLDKTNIPYDIAVLSNQRKFANFYIEDNNVIGTGASLYKENTPHYSQGKRLCVTTKRLDDCNYIKGDIDLIKIDVQGSELDIILGGIETCKKSKYIMIETSLIDYNINGPQIDSIFNIMSELGFYTNTILELHKNGYIENNIFQIDFLFENFNYKNK